MKNPRRCFYCFKWIWLTASVDGGWIITDAEDGHKHICSRKIKRKSRKVAVAKENRILLI